MWNYSPERFLLIYTLHSNVYYESDLHSSVYESVLLWLGIENKYEYTFNVCLTNELNTIFFVRMWFLNTVRHF